jgi:predicted DNA binding CopG/RHH family protein
MTDRARSKRIRINLRLPEDLVAYAKKVAAKSRTTFTQVIVSLLMEMKEKKRA